MRTDSPTCSQLMVNLIFAHADSMGLQLKAGDISAAFLQGVRINPPRRVCMAPQMHQDPFGSAFMKFFCPAASKRFHRKRQLTTGLALPMKLLASWAPTSMTSCGQAMLPWMPPWMKFRRIFGSVKLRARNSSFVVEPSNKLNMVLKSQGSNRFSSSPTVELAEPSLPLNMRSHSFAPCWEVSAGWQGHVVLTFATKSTVCKRFRRKLGSKIWLKPIASWTMLSRLGAAASSTPPTAQSSMTVATLQASPTLVRDGSVGTGLSQAEPWP